MAKRIRKPINEMSFLDHLEELRWILVRATIATVIAACFVYVISDWLFADVIFAPTHVDFFTYRFFCDLSHKINFLDTVCVDELPFTIQNLEMEGQVNNFVWICLVGGFVIAFPYVLWQFWKFISPALYEKERRSARTFIIVSSLLFFLGVLFGYYIVVPMTVNFVATFSVDPSIVKNNFTLDSYIGMVKTSIIASGLYFELPIIIYFLSKIGLVTPDFLRKYRKYGIIGILIIAAIVTPPDVVSQTIVAIPMLGIYELSILISALVVRRKLREEKSAG